MFKCLEFIFCKLYKSYLFVIVLQIDSVKLKMSGDRLRDLQEGGAADDAAVVHLLRHRLPIFFDVILRNQIKFFYLYFQFLFDNQNFFGSIK